MFKDWHELLDPDLHPILNIWRFVVFAWAFLGIIALSILCIFIINNPLDAEEMGMAA